ncbi:hypothetical protein OEZ85_002778 [Tetradesmus obliquus]|uniref:Uncharacterized protein n=1 Tax=Tetradesmus obliquus TaxID=3088 RepID=A0ABY8TYL1_TETOB|nr:hypothetical protein OEZ85_002778 [Tetradesmus obliquus]
MQRQSSRAGAHQLRKMFIKVIKDSSAAFDARTDGPRFIRAALEFQDDPVDLLYCLTKPQEHGPRRLKAALSCADDPAFIKDLLLPFLALLGCDALGRGTCRQPLISLLETIYTALCQRPPFLPRETDSHLQLSACPEAALLDRQFRLLREDMVGPLRKELADLNITAAAAAAAAVASSTAGGATQAAAGSGAAPRPPASSGSSSNWLAAAASSRNVFRDPAVLGVCFKPRPCIMLSVTLPPGHRGARLRTKAERVGFWSSYGHGTLPADALVCLASPSWPLVFATVVRRDVQEMAEEQPMVGLAFEPGQDAEQVLQAMARGPMANTVLVQVSTNFLSTRPVLQGLQAMPSVPMAQELVHGQEPQPTTYLDVAAVEKDLEQLAPSLDPSQLAALRQALQQRNALIQGPPGTGKTFTGALLCDLILKHSSETILCVCYTNHALDQFLESLLDKGIDKIVRIGSRSKSKRLEQYSLRELAAKARGQTLNAAESRRFGALHAEIESAQKRVEYFAQLLAVTAGPAGAAASSSNSSSTTGGSGGSGNGRRGHASAASAAAAAAAKAQAVNEAWAKRSKQLQEQQEQAKQKRLAAAWAQGRLRRQDSVDGDDEDADCSFKFDEWGDGVGPYLADELPGVFEQLSVPEGMTRISRNYLWQLWLKGSRNKGAVDRWMQSLSSSSGATGRGSQGDGAWHAAKRSKHSQQESSPEFTPSPAVTAAANALRAGQPVNVAAPELLQHVWSLPGHLRQAVAASWRGKLRARWAEELGEELQQAHKLQQELRSLQDSSYEPLLAQARVVGATTTGAALHKALLTSQTIAPKVVMIEEAAEILEAHVLTSLSPSTQHLIQIGDHKQLRPKVESYELSVQAGRGHSLNVSLFERLVTAGAPHTTLAVQHRMHPDISRLIKHTYPALQDHPSVASRPPVKGLDQGSGRVLFIDHTQPELQEAKGGIWSAAAEHQSKVNMHEGEEADVVVASLVRSNSKGSVGFLREPERINVLLSRARDGLILIGNTTTLRNASSAAARKHWGVVLDQLEASSSIVKGLPAICQRHSRSLGQLNSAEAFALHAPDGGCTMPCNATLPCGHACKLRCHAYDAQHEKQKCEELVLELCEAGHITTRHCCAAEAVCSTCVDIRKLLEDEKLKLRKLVTTQLRQLRCFLAAIRPAAAHLSWRFQKAVMKLLKFEAVITVCLALAGRAAAASAWGVITSVDYPELSTTAALLTELGWAGPLSGRFTGTLLLPNNDAWDDYIRSTDYLPTLDASGGKAEAGFFAALMRYHTLQRAVADPYVGGTWSTKHMKEPGFIRHKISFENDSIGAFAVDEQEGTANIAITRSQKVDGGGYIHVIAAVLEPDDLFKSLNVMFTSWPDEDLDNFADLLKELGMQTMWSDKCKWISDAALSQGYENITPSPSHSCATSAGQDCGPYFYDPVAAMNPGGLIAFNAIIMSDWDDRVTRATNAGTLALERYAGTFLLPNNMALPDITMRSAQEWIPALQFHFISAGSAPVAFTSNQLMRWSMGRFPAPNARVNLLGKMLQNPAYKITFISLNGFSTGCRSPPCLSVQYPTKAGRMDSARFLDKAVNLQAPNVLYHVIQKVMVPPCGTDDACYAAFRRP